MSAATLGFRVKSGYAIAVALRGPAAAPRIVGRWSVALSDPAAADTRQPFHHGLFTHETDTSALARRIAIVERCAIQSMQTLLAEPSLEWCAGAALVVGSVIDPGTVGNPHIRAHASEGQLFRRVLQSALEARGIRCEVVVEKQLPAKASARLQRRAADITRVVARLGREIGGPWRADEKSATTAAWLVLE